MRKRPLGKTGLVASEMSLGTFGLSGDAYGIVTEQEAEAVVSRAVDIGITSFETSDAYGAGKVEAILGRVLGKRDDVVVVTKLGLDRTTDPPKRRLDAEYLEKAIARSAKRLQRDAVDVVLLHHPRHESLYTPELPGVMKGFKAKGLIRAWGVAAGDLDVAQSAINIGAEVIEMAYNLVHSLDVHRIAGDLMIERCGLLARSVLGYGLLAGEWPKDKTFPENDHRRDRWTGDDLERRLGQLDALRFLVHGDVHTLRAAAVRFVLANHLVTSAVLGPRTITQLEQLVRETGGGPRYLPDEDLRELPRVLERVGVSM